MGIGPGGGCTTRLSTNFGVPQVEAIVQCRIAVGERVPIIADGGVRRHGSIAAALVFGGETVMLGSAFAGTLETPGDIVLKRVLMPESQKIVSVPFKVFRGMASIGAVRDRLDLEEADPRELEALGAEGLEVSVPARGSVRGSHPRHAQAPVLLHQLRRRALVVGVSPAVLVEPGSVSDEAVASLARGIVRA